jgi:GT2 family glycosyltransferase
MEPATVTAVVVNYNTGGRLQALLDSLMSDPKVLKTVVVDNASTDCSLDFLLTTQDSRIQLIRNDHNRGFGAACNQGAALAATPFLLFINPDCVFPTGSLARMTIVLETQPGTAMIGPLILNDDGSEQRGCRRHIPDPRRALMRVLGLGHPDSQGQVSGFDLVGTPLPSSPVTVEAISGACMLLRRAIFNQLNGWDEGYFLHCEDIDFCMRIKRAGWKIMFVPNVAVMHHQGQSSRRRPVFVLWHKHRGMWRFYNKYYREDASWFLTLLIWVGIWIRFSLLALGAFWILLFRRFRLSKAVR